MMILAQLPATSNALARKLQGRTQRRVWLSSPLVGLAALAAVLLGAAWIAGTGLATVMESGFTSLNGEGSEPTAPTVKLDKTLEERFTQAKAAAAAAGVGLFIEAGVRPEAAQRSRFNQAVADAGSVKEAAKRVTPPEASLHVKGQAIDVGPEAGWTWLAQHQGEFGLCQTKLNQPGHFEAKVSPGEVCPAPADGQPSD